jgi:hypothetical protein
MPNCYRPESKALEDRLRKIKIHGAGLCRIKTFKFRWDHLVTNNPLAESGGFGM